MSIQSSRLSEHKVYRLRKMFESDGFWGTLLGIVVYDPADDGPEVPIIRFFNLFPEGSYTADSRRTFLEVE